MKKEVIEKLATLIISAMGLIAALAWNETIKAFFNKILSSPNTLWGMLVYAVVITIIAVFITIKLGNLLKKI
ncbi:MAG: DUF5654 family protein [Nanoarchaeota archaeon]|nr:DUF5654 family protein [Nanoarchaeota archaeon]